MYEYVSNRNPMRSSKRCLYNLSMINNYHNYTYTYASLLFKSAKLLLDLSYIFFNFIIFLFLMQR